MGVCTGSNPFAIAGCCALASIPFSTSILKDKKEAVKMICYAAISALTQTYFEQFAFQPLAPHLIGGCAAFGVHKWIFREDNALQLAKFVYINIGARTALTTAAQTAFGVTLTGSSSITAMALASSGGFILATWAICKVAQKILHQDKPKTA